MDISYPFYYKKFRCIAGACPDSCCKDWAVQIDEESAYRYGTLDGALGDALRASLQEEDGDTILALTPNGRCPMWRSDGLCRIQAELGEDWLCHTCREFPRLRHEYGSFTELGLELSCPEAAKLILSSVRHEYITDSIPGSEPPDYDTEAMEILLRSRDEVLVFLSTTRLPVGEALATILLFGHAVQSELDGGDPASLYEKETLETAHRIAASASEADLIAFFKSLEILTPGWRMKLETPSPVDWQDSHRALAIYFIERYWLQAVSDYDLIARVKLCVTSCLMIKLLGGDLLQTSQLYSKEIENNINNVFAILDGAYTCAPLTDVRLLGLLLEK